MRPQPTVMTPSLEFCQPGCHDSNIRLYSHNEEPSPAGNSVTAIKSKTSGGNEATERTAQHLEHEERCQTLAQLVLGVPGTEEVDHSGEEDSFGDTEEDTDGEEAFVAMDSGSEGADGSPDHSGAADVYINVC